MAKDHEYARLISNVIFDKCIFTKTILSLWKIAISLYSGFFSSSRYLHYILFARNRFFRMPESKKRKIGYNQKLMFIFLVFKCFSVLFAALYINSLGATHFLPLYHYISFNFYAFHWSHLSEWKLIVVYRCQSTE